MRYGANVRAVTALAATADERPQILSAASEAYRVCELYQRRIAGRRLRVLVVEGADADVASP